jgi:hypothetical protein
MSPSKHINKLITDLGDWRGDILTHFRKIIHDADPDIIEEWKWMGSPCWSRSGLIVVGNAHKDKIKLTFSQGAKLSDPDKIFNNGLEGNRWRAIDFNKNDQINEHALRELIQTAVLYNLSKEKKQIKKPQDGVI